MRPVDYMAAVVTATVFGAVFVGVAVVAFTSAIAARAFTRVVAGESE